MRVKGKIIIIQIVEKDQKSKKKKRFKSTTNDD